MRRLRGLWLVAVWLPAMIPVCDAAVAASAGSSAVQNTIRVMKRRFQQNRIELERLYGGYRNVKRLAPPGKEVAADLERAEMQFYKAYKAGRKGEARRELHRAFALLSGREWTRRDEYVRSLVLVAGVVVFDPRRPLTARVEQLYQSSYESSSPLRARVRLLDAQAPRRRPPEKELRALEIDGTANLMEKPLALTADVSDVENGNYLLAVDVFEGGEPLRRLSTPVRLIRGIETAHGEIERRLKAIENPDAIEGFDSAQATIRYPFDFARVVNRGDREPRAYDFRAGIRRSTELMAAIENGRNPLWNAAGDHTRHYWFEAAGEIMPYRIYVPSAYDRQRAFPLIVALHGGGGDENVMIGRRNGPMTALAERHGYIVVSPLGYRPYGGYGRPFDETRMPDLVRRTRLSEQDVMNVLARVRSEYRIDEDRIYLMGHSMGGNGTWRLGAKYPDVWAALAPIAAGSVTPEGFVGGRVAPGDGTKRVVSRPYDFDAIKHIPVLVCHGALDPRAPVEHARAMVARMKERGMTYEYFEKPNGTHAMVQFSRPRVLEFFNRHRRGQKSTGGSTKSANEFRTRSTPGERTGTSRGGSAGT